MSSALLTIKDINFSYETSDGWQLLIDELQFMPGQMTGIVGPNGSGKSTLLRIAAGIVIPDTGSVYLDDILLKDLSRRELALKMGYLPQESVALYDYTVTEVVQMGRYAHQSGFAGISAADNQAVANALAVVELEGYKHKMLSHLSGGERRRALIASVLAQQPDLMLLDEPTSGLDINHAAGIFRLLASLSKTGPGIVVVTHDINLAALFCDRLIVVNNGKIFAEGIPENIITEKMMNDLYNNEVLVIPHPQINRPMTLPLAERLPDK